jgi:pyruvate ferredoxin oxidoreductase beta subunit
MSKERIAISPDLYDIMPSDYQDLVKNATYGKEDRGWKDIGTSKELIEQHSLCAGCPESMAFRYILASLPNPEDTVMVGSTGCTSLVFPMVAVHNIHSLFGNQNAVASGLKRALSVRFPNRIKDVVVLAGDGATVDIGLDMTLQAWFRQYRWTGKRSHAEGICGQNGAGGQTVRQSAPPGDRAGIRLSLHRELHREQALSR